MVTATKNPGSSFPLISAELMNELEGRFPDKLSRDPVASVEDLRYWQGQQNVLDLLRRQFATQNTTIFKGR